MKRLTARTSVSVLHHRAIARLVTAATILALGAFALPQSQTAVHAQVGGGQYAGPTTLTEGQVYTGQLGTFTDPLCKAHNYYVATVDWGDGHTDIAGISGTCTYTVNDTHVYQEEGNHILKVSVRSSADGSVVQFSGNVAVADAALSPGTPLTVAFTEGKQLNGPVIGTFSDADQFTNPANGALVCDGTASDYKVSVDWGDGTHTDNLSGAVTAISGTPCGFNIAASHNYAEEGTYTLRATVTDAGGSSTVVGGTAVVGDAALSTLSSASFHGVEGTGLPSQYLGTIVDGDGQCQAADYTATINWGDATPLDVSTARIFPSSHTTTPCAFDVYGTHTYTEESPAGGYLPAVLVTDHSATTTINAVATIADARLTDLQTTSLTDPACALTGCPLVEGVANTNIYLGTFHDTNLSPGPADGCLTDTFTVSVNWGDGVTTPGTFAPAIANPVPNKPGQPGFCNFDVFGTHTYSEEKFSGYQATVTITDTAGNAVTTLLDNAVVQDNQLVAVSSETLGILPDPAIVEGAAFTRVLAVFNDPDPYCTLADVLANPPSAEDYGATINWGDGTAVDTVSSAASPVGQIVPDPVLGGCNFDVVGTHTYAEDTTAGAPYHLVITIHDTPYNKIVIDDTAIVGPTTASVTDAPINQVGPSPSFTFTEGVANKNIVLGTFHDTAGDGSTPNACGITDYVATIDWGDGAASEQLVPPGSEPVSVYWTANGGGTPYGTIVPSADGVPCDFDVVGNYTYEEQGSFSIGIQIYDLGTGGPPAGPPLAGWSDAVTVNDASLVQDATSSFQPVEGHPSVSTNPGQPAGFQYLGTFTDQDPFCHATDFQVTVDWNDGTVVTSPDATLLIAAPSTHSADRCAFDVYGVHTYTEEGTYTLAITVTDVTDPGASESVVSWNDTAKVVDAALSTLTQHNITSVEGAVNGVIPSTGTYLGTIIDSAANPVTCATPNDFFNEGTGQIVVNWGDGTSDTLTGGADVPSQAGGLGMVVVQVADGTYGAADPSGNGCYFDVFGSHTYVEESEPNLPYRITVTIQDAGGSTTILHDTATVADSPLQAYTPAAQLTQCDLLSNQGDPCTGVIGGFQDPVVDNTGALSCESEANPVGSTPESIPFHYQVSINWGDGSPADTTTGQIAEVGGVPNGTCQFEVTGTHTYTTLGTFPVTITVTDEGHLVGSNDGAVLVTSSDSITSVVPAATAPLARPYGSAIVQYSYPNLNTPTYVLNLALYAYNNAVSGGVPPFNSPPPPWMTGHNNFYDRQAHLSIPGPVAGGIDPGAVDPRGCQNTFQPVYQCKLIPLSVVCSTAGSNGFAPFNTGKTETIWEKYQYTLPPHLGQPVLTRYARYDLQDYDPPIGGKIADNFQITMSSSTNPAVAAISNPPSPPDSHVFITC